MNRRELLDCDTDGAAAVWLVGDYYVRMRDFGTVWDVTRVETFERWALAEHADLSLEEAAVLVGVSADDLAPWCMDVP